MARRRQSRVPQWLSAGPVIGSVGGWVHFHEPFRIEGLLAVVAIGLLAGAMTPGIAVSAASLPLLLVPVRLRCWWRRGAPRNAQRSSYIPLRLRRAVLAADWYRCAWCHSTERLQIDHIRPWSRGGLTVLWNLMTLCGECNRLKSDYWIYRGGRARYNAFEGWHNPDQADGILRYEKLHRWSPGRWIRAGWSLTI
jgi:hypothetical protein